MRSAWLVGAGIGLLNACATRAPQHIPAYAGIDAQVVPYVVTKQPLLDTMFELARPTRDDVLYDLGCGDGRIIIQAAQRFGTRGVGVDIDPALVERSLENAAQAGVSELTRFVHGDLFDMDLHEPSVVTLYLLHTVNLRLRSKLFRELKPGARVVSNTFDMGEWRPDAVRRVVAERPYHVYFWVMPLAVGGRYRLRVGTEQGRLTLHQRFQELSGTVHLGDRTYEINTGTIVGNGIDLSARASSGDTLRVEGWMTDGTFRGTVYLRYEAWPWLAELDPSSGQDRPPLVTGHYRLTGAPRPDLELRVFDRAFTLHDGTRKIDIPDSYIFGESIYFTHTDPDDDTVVWRCTARIENGALEGVLTNSRGERYDIRGAHRGS